MVGDFLTNRATVSISSRTLLSDVSNSSGNRELVFLRRPTYFSRWVGGNIGSTDATKTSHNLNAFIFETNNRKVVNNTSLDSL
jgi:hypothetical protein